MAVILSASDEGILRSEMYKRIDEDLKLIRSGESKAERVILIVPAQETLQTEEEGFKFLGGKGFFDFAVMSGAKLRSEILKETGKPDKIAINTIGRKMLLRRITGKRRSELKSFAAVSGSEGFLDMAGDFVVQLKQNEIDPQQLQKLSEKEDLPSLLSSKLSDMQLIYSDYEKVMSGKYTDSEDLLKFTTSQIKNSDYLKSSIIWYCDFYSFTRREYEFLAELNKYAAGFNAAFLSGQDEYVCGEETAAKMASQLGIKRVILPSGKSGASNIRVIDCASPYSQSRTIAADILSKVRDKNYGFGDVIVLTQDMDNMGENLKNVLTASGIPVFMDEKRTMTHTLTARVIASVLEIASSGFKRQAVLEFLKCGISGYGEDDIALFENYIKQYKIYDKAYLKPFRYGKDKLGEEKFILIENMRQHLEALFVPFIERFSDSASVSDKTRSLYVFLTEDLKLPDVLKKFSEYYEEKSYLDASGELSQSFGVLIDLMDQMAELFGDEEMSSSEYASLFTSCFEDVKLGLLPQAEGKVRIGTVTRSSFSDIKVLYIAGFNDGIIPSDMEAGNILTGSEISRLAEEGFVLAKDSDVIQMEEMYQIERALNTKTEETVLCVCSADLEGNALRPSMLLRNMPNLSSLKHEKDIDETKDNEGYIQSKELVYSKLPQMLKALVYGSDIPEIWKAGYNEVKEDSLAKTAAESVFFKPSGGSIGSKLSDKLFEKSGDSYLSPSQLEQYSLCPFKHYISYGLNPEELNSFDVGSREAGTIYHEVLLELSEKLSSQCREKGISMTDPKSPWMTVTEDEIKKDIKEIIEKNGELILGGVMNSDDASMYRVSRIEAVCAIFAKYMIEQVRKGKISAMYFETQFGRKALFPPVEIETPVGKAVIEGQIDRVDILGRENEGYVKIIDYKSGNKSFDKEKIKAGLDLQLMIYLEGALGYDKDYRPAGVFYYAVKDPEKAKDYIDVIADSISEDAANKMAADFALDGIAVKDPNVLSAMDSSLTGTGSVDTTVFNLGKRSGYKGLIEPEDMEELRLSFKAKLTEICTELKEGDISINPAFYKKENAACKFCDYSSVCLYNLKYD